MSPWTTQLSLSQQHLSCKSMSYPRIFEMDPAVSQFDVLQKAMTPIAFDARENERLKLHVISLQKKLSEAEERRESAEKALALGRVRETAIRELLKQLRTDCHAQVRRTEEEKETALAEAHEASRIHMLEVLDQNAALSSHIEALEQNLEEVQEQLRAKEQAFLQRESSARFQVAECVGEQQQLRGQVHCLEHQVSQLKTAFLQVCGALLQTEIHVQVLGKEKEALRTQVQGFVGELGGPHRGSDVTQCQMQPSSGATMGGTRTSSTQASPEAVLEPPPRSHADGDKSSEASPSLEEGCLDEWRSSVPADTPRRSSGYRVSVTTTLYWLIS